MTANLPNIRLYYGVWDAATGQPLTSPLKHQAEVLSAASSPDSTRVVTPSWDKTARVWDAAALRLQIVSTKSTTICGTVYLLPASIGSGEQNLQKAL